MACSRRSFHLGRINLPIIRNDGRQGVVHGRPDSVASIHSPCVVRLFGGRKLPWSLRLLTRNPMLALPAGSRTAERGTQWVLYGTIHHSPLSLHPLAQAECRSRSCSRSRSWSRVCFKECRFFAAISESPMPSRAREKDLDSLGSQHPGHAAGPCLFVEIRETITRGCHKAVHVAREAAAEALSPYRGGAASTVQIGSRDVDVPERKRTRAMERDMEHLVSWNVANNGSSFVHPSLAHLHCVLAKDQPNDTDEQKPANVLRPWLNT